MQKYAALFAWILLVGLRSQAQQPQLLILGTAHLANPGHDMFNTVVDDVLVPKRQTEIVDIVNRLAAFKPTHVALECDPSRQAEFDKNYADYRAGRYTLTRNERDQIGMRLAAKLNLSRVECVDYQEDLPGPVAAYNFMAFGPAHKDLQPVMDAIMAQGKRHAAEETEFIHSHPLIDYYRKANEPLWRDESDSVYMRYIAAIENDKEHPGANWVGTWHTRNMIIVENLRRIAKPGDRVFTIFGAGHGYLMNEFASQSGAFTIVDTESYLR